MRHKLFVGGMDTTPLLRLAMASASGFSRFRANAARFEVAARSSRNVCWALSCLWQRIIRSLAATAPRRAATSSQRSRASSLDVMDPSAIEAIVRAFWTLLSKFARGPSRNRRRNSSNAGPGSR